MPIIHYWHRIEFQKRGAEHCHALLWNSNVWEPLDFALLKSELCFKQAIRIIEHCADLILSTFTTDENTPMYKSINTLKDVKPQKTFTRSNNVNQDFLDYL